MNANLKACGAFGIEIAYEASGLNIWSIWAQDKAARTRTDFARNYCLTGQNFNQIQASLGLLFKRGTVVNKCLRQEIQVISGQN